MNPNAASYSQSLQFYESQYREKLKEVEQEKKTRKSLEERVDEVESTMRELMEENVKLKDDLKECVTDNNILSQHFQMLQEEKRQSEPLNSELEERNIALNKEGFRMQEELRAANEEKTALQRRNAVLVTQVEDIGRENRKWMEQHQQMKERMQSLRQMNKQLEQKSNTNWLLLRKNDIFRDTEDRMLKAEQRVKELEESLAQFIEDFETLNSDLSVCAQKLALAESRVEILTKKCNDLDTQNTELIDKITKVKKPPPKTVKVNLCAHYEGKGVNAEELMRCLETQNVQILTLSKTLESLRKENREYFERTMEQ